MFVVATAGHVDHGKSTLVRALTGMEPDRFAEERRRGMTIDLGFAWTRLPSGEEVAFVDVPGHQRFIATMLAGLGPAPAVLFVVAADEGWGRQSGEHLAAADALQVRHAVLAVTRSDLADPAPAMAEARERLARSSLGVTPAVAVSGRTGAGLDELRAALDDLRQRLPVAPVDGPVRMWVDRSFTVRGSGTVVTGTLAAGTVRTGDQVEVAGLRAVVRAVQSLGGSRPAVAAPARVALNLRGVGPDAVGRGDVVLTPGRWWFTDVVDVHAPAPDALPTHPVLHIGTAAVPVRVRPLAGAVARLTLDRPLPLRTGDRGVLRDPGRQSVAGAVRVLDADPPPLTRRGDAGRRGAALAAGAPAPADEVRRRGAVRREHLARLGVPVAAITGVRTSGDWLVDEGTWRGWVAAAGAAADAWARTHPLDPPAPQAAFAHALGLPDPALATPVATAAGLTVDAGRVRARQQPGGLGPAEPAVAALGRRLLAEPFAAPTADELADLRLGRRELAAAAKAGRVLRLPGDVVLAPDAVDRACDVLGALPQPFTMAQARQALNTTRRVAVPLLEHLDGLGRTERVDAQTRRLVAAR